MGYFLTPIKPELLRKLVLEQFNRSNADIRAKQEMYKPHRLTKPSKTLSKEFNLFAEEEIKKHKN